MNVFLYSVFFHTCVCIFYYPSDYSIIFSHTYNPPSFHIFSPTHTLFWLSVFSFTLSLISKATLHSAWHSKNNQVKTVSILFSSGRGKLRAATHIWFKTYIWWWRVELQLNNSEHMRGPKKPPKLSFQCLSYWVLISPHTDDDFHRNLAAIQSPIVTDQWGVERQQGLFHPSLCCWVWMSWPTALLWQDVPKIKRQQGCSLCVPALTCWMLNALWCHFFHKSLCLKFNARLHLSCWATSASTICLCAVSLNPTLCLTL